MEVRAVAKYVRVQPRKVRILATEVKGKTAIMAAAKLQYHPSKSAEKLRQVIVSAMANAAENNGLSPTSLRIRSISVDEGPKQKRITQKAMGRGARIEKKTAHITVILEDFEPKPAPKPHGTKAKPRPKFEAPKKAKAVKEDKPKVEEVVAEEAAAEEVVETTEAPAEAPAETTAEEKQD